jgi:hypothetical protein
MWTQEETDKLRKWHAEGISFGVMAERLGNKSRCAVAGRCARLGLAGRLDNIKAKALAGKIAAARQRVSRAIRAQEREREKALKKPPKTEVTSDIQALIAIPTNAFLSQEKGKCRWPHGDVCQEKALELRPYCAEHHERSRAPSGERRAPDPAAERYRVANYLARQGQ